MKKPGSKFTFGSRFSEDGPEDILSGEIDLNTDPSMLPAKSIVDTLAKKDKFILNVKEHMRLHKQDLVIFIHGFRNDFRDSVNITRELKSSLIACDFDCDLMVFSWPSDKLLALASNHNYRSDRDDAMHSGKAIGRSFLFINEFYRSLTCDLNAPPDRLFCGRKIHLIAHSMGCYALRFALLSLCIELGAYRLPKLFDQIFLIAADEDVDAFEHEYKLKNLPSLANRITVYFNRKDLALVASDLTKNNPDRLGAEGPSRNRAISERVVAVDCEDIVKPTLKDPVGHSYFSENQSFLLDMVSSLKGMRDDDRNRSRVFVPHSIIYRLV
ncbi:MAG: alpha/beta hydrolase [Candidatus Caenarcaniphilales bacterium]|nr:alpha/beta hydrolase [Candidatus Caenarcaniphilales bacterium]